MRSRIRTAEVNGKRVVVMDKEFDGGLWKQTIKNVYKCATSGTPSQIEKFIKSNAKRKREHARELYELKEELLKAAM